MRTSGSVIAAGALLVFALAATGCSGGGSGTAAAKKDTGASASKPPDNPQPGGGGNFCKVLKDELLGLSAAFPKDFTDSKQLQAYGGYVKASNAKLRAAAPAEIRDAVNTSTRVSDTTADAYAAGGKPSADALNQLRSPEYQAAAKQVAAYAKDHCRLSPSFGLGS
ncbi:MAG: hypothetical protein ABJA34_02570 [Pseudonocardiales bacterium]